MANNNEQPQPRPQQQDQPQPQQDAQQQQRERQEQKIRVKITYNPDLSKIGDVVELSRTEAAGMVAEGRGVYVDASGQPVQATRPSAPSTQARPVLTPTPQEGNPGPAGPTAGAPAPTAPESPSTRRGNNSGDRPG